MSLLYIFFGIFVVWYVVIPLITKLSLYLLRRKARKMFGEGFAEAFRQANRQGHQSGNEPVQPEPHAKKIGKDVGEYVKFEELSVERHVEAETDGTTTRVEMEQQVSDAEWEEVKP